MAFNIYDFYDKMEQNGVMFSFKGEVSAESLTSILQIVEMQLENLNEKTSVKKRVFNILVESLQNLFHHIDKMSSEKMKKRKNAIFMIAKSEGVYTVMTGNYIKNGNVKEFEKQLEGIKALDQKELKNSFRAILVNGKMSSKGGGGLGVIDIALKSKGEFDFAFFPVDKKYSFFSLNINIKR